jgi:hypothetical protein
VIALPAIAGTAKKADHSGMSAKGTITAWDDATKTMKVKDESGKEMSITWNDQTKVMGTAKVGEMVKVEFKKEKDTMMATHVIVGKENIEKAGMDH